MRTDVQRGAPRGEKRPIAHPSTPRCCVYAPRRMDSMALQRDKSAQPFTCRGSGNLRYVNSGADGPVRTGEATQRVLSAATSAPEYILCC